MENTRFLILALVVALISIPVVLTVKKFATYDTGTNFRVTFDPLTCHKCRDCPCTYTLNNGQDYVLNKIDKNRCITDSGVVTDGIKKGLDSVTVEFSVKTYGEFYDCLRWYSNHPTAYKVDQY